MRPLEETQKAFFAALQMPLRGTSRASTELPPNEGGHSEEFLTRAEELMAAGDNLSSAERLELYHRQYWFRVLESLADDFPVLRRMAGEEKFWELLEAYLLAHPSSSFTLRHLGRFMPGFVVEWQGLDDVKRRWFSAVAGLEYAAMEAFEAAEREPLPPERLADTELELQPHVRLLALPVPAHLCHGWDEFEPVEEEATRVAVWRGESGGAHMVRLDEVEYVLLLRLREGGRLIDLFAEPVEPEPAPEDVQEWFSAWQSRGWITARGSEVIELKVGDHEDWSGLTEMASQAMAMED